MTDNPIQAIRSIAVVGGTGKEGKGLAYRWAKAGYTILIGSRQVERAQAAAAEMKALLGREDCVEGLANPDAAAAGDLVVVTVPYSAHADTLRTIQPIVQGKIVVDVTVPLAPPRVTRVQMPPAGSAAMEARQILGEGVEIVSAFQNLSYERLLHDEPIECDILVCGTSKAARVQVLDLIVKMGLVGWDAGPLENSVVPEGLTSILIGLNKQYGVQSAGIKITGIPA
ncbi:MAG TPA: NADPH-dependent F420 reductase [Anaerolineaceae bacterium]|nr:NADPH-dependent F420 reductase [Anaerolineaceae bacterium]